MSQDREIAGALSEGLNILVAIDRACRTGAAPLPSWVPVLAEMERALAAVKSGVIQGSISVHEHHLESLKKLRSAIEQWCSGVVPPALEAPALVRDIIGAFGEPSQILAGAADSS